MTLEKAIWHNLNRKKVLEILETSDEGLSGEEVEKRRKKFGANKLPEEKILSPLKIFFDQFRNPLIYILIIAGFITLFLSDFTDSIIIFVSVVLNTIIGYFQEVKYSKALKELKKILKIKTIVFREGKEKEILQEEIVPGDIVLLKAGGKVPADGRLLEAHNLKVNESALTGEWQPAEKNTNIMDKGVSLADRDNMVFMGTIIEEGRAKAIIVNTGVSTELGKIAQLVKETKEEKTPYQKKLIQFSKITGAIILIICFFIFFIGIISGRNLIEIFTVAVAIAVAGIPEGLPMAMTVILALGMQKIAKRKGLVRRLASAETLGSTSIIATDKTGTLTEGKMQVDGIFTGTAELLSDGKKYLQKVDLDGRESHLLALKIAMLTNEAFIENSDQPLEEWIVRGGSTEKALLLAGITAGLAPKNLEKEQPKIDEILFSSVYKYSASLRRFSEKENILYIKGAPEIILDKSVLIELDGRQEKISENKFKELKQKYEKLTSRGLRVLAMAYKIKGSEENYKNKQELSKEISNLIFVGFIALKDPLRLEAKKMIRICKEAGLRPIIVSGDHKLTVKAIAEELGLPTKEKNIIEGRELDKLSDEEFKKRVKEIEIYARVEPAQKLRIIKAWQEKGEVIAMTGDGINDAPALKGADIGIALGSGTAVAKEVSDLVLLDDNFSVIVAAVEEGRAIIDNIRKVITYLLSSSFSEVILVGMSLLFGWPLPVLAGQILWVNLIEDSLPNISLSFEPKENDLMKLRPTGHHLPLLNREMKTLVFITGIITDFFLLCLFFWLLKYSNYGIVHIRSIIFAALAIDSLFYVFSCKSLRKNIWQINIFSNKLLLYSWLICLIALVSAFYVPQLQIILKTEALNFFDWQLILSLGIVNLIFIELTKWFFIHPVKSREAHRQNP